MTYPTHLGKYAITDELGKGAMGVVYAGFDPGIERKVAIKTIHKAMLEGEDGEELKARFKREAQAAGRLMHQNIVAIYEYGEDSGTPFIAMEFVQGKELKDFIKNSVRFDLARIVTIFSQTLDALEYVHAAGVVHRDIKPANIILLENDKVKVADFGIARVESSEMTTVGTVMGTLSYMSPEQFEGKQVDSRSDLFAMGVILYELLTGEKPFSGEGFATIMHKVVNAPAEDPTLHNYDIPKSFAAVINKALEKRAADRFQSAKQFKEAIELAVLDKYVADVPAPNDGGTFIGTPRISPKVAQASSIVTTRKSPMALILSVGIVLLVATLAGWWWQQNTPSDHLELPSSSVPTTETKPSSSPEPAAIMTAHGFVNAVSTPPGAVILVDGGFMDVTPSKIELPVGEYQLVLKKDGFHDLKASLEVTSEETVDLDVELEPL